MPLCKPTSDTVLEYLGSLGINVSYLKQLNLSDESIADFAERVEKLMVKGIK